jgi:hypothetical protein
MKHEVLKWAIANIPEHLYLTKPKQGVAFWGVGFPVDVLKKTPRSVVRGNTLYGVFHSGYVVKDNTSVESGEDRYSVMGPRERFAPRRPKVLLAQERGKRLAAAAAKELEKTPFVRRVHYCSTTIIISIKKSLSTTIILCKL